VSGRRTLFVDGQEYHVRIVVYGGMGSVHLLEACHPEAVRPGWHHIAAKTFSPGLSESAIRREFSVWLKLQHENILPLLGIATVNDDVAAVSPWRFNGTLVPWTSEPPPPNVVAAITVQLALALHHAWQAHRVVHLDIKPSNMFLNELATEVQLGDWGIARIVGAERVSGAARDDPPENAGTVPYMAPERFDNASANRPQADMYSLGVLAHQLLWGKLPFAEGISLSKQLVTDARRQIALSELPQGSRWFRFFDACLHPLPDYRPIYYRALIALVPLLAD
jgi:serine/threonine protein kinase